MGYDGFPIYLIVPLHPDMDLLGIIHINYLIYPLAHLAKLARFSPQCHTDCPAASPFLF